MFRSFGKFVLTFGVLALIASPAWAQARKGAGGFGGMGGGGTILMAENVQKDLKLTEEQVGKIQDTLREIRQKHADDFAAIADLPRGERLAKTLSVNKEVTDEIKKGLSLTAEQSKRFDQITLQTRGLMAFAEPTVQEKLNLTGEQKTQIREIADSARGAGAVAPAKDATKEERTEAFRKMRARQQENMKKVQALLTDDQKKAWKELTGDPIEIQFQPRRRPNN